MKNSAPILGLARRGERQDVTEKGLCHPPCAICALVERGRIRHKLTNTFFRVEIEREESHRPDAGRSVKSCGMPLRGRRRTKISIWPDSRLVRNPAAVRREIAVSLPRTASRPGAWGSCRRRR